MEVRVLKRKPQSLHSKRVQHKSSSGAKWYMLTVMIGKGWLSTEEIVLLTRQRQPLLAKFMTFLRTCVWLRKLHEYGVIERIGQKGSVRWMASKETEEFLKRSQKPRIELL
jgi:hypothetical protein